MAKNLNQRITFQPTDETAENLKKACARLNKNPSVFINDLLTIFDDSVLNILKIRGERKNILFAEELKDALFMSSFCEENLKEDIRYKTVRRLLSGDKLEEVLRELFSMLEIQDLTKKNINYNCLREIIRIFSAEVIGATSNSMANNYSNFDGMSNAINRVVVELRNELKRLEDAGELTRELSGSNSNLPRLCRESYYNREWDVFVNDLAVCSINEIYFAVIKYWHVFSTNNLVYRLYFLLCTLVSTSNLSNLSQTNTQRMRANLSLARLLIDNKIFL